MVWLMLFIAAVILFFIKAMREHMTAEVRLRTEIVEVAGLKESLGIVSITDLHAGTFTTGRAINSLMGRLHELYESDQPVTAIVFGGDEVDLGTEFIWLFKLVVRFCQGYFPGAIILEHPGDHTIGEAPNEIRAAIEELGGQVLHNKVVEIKDDVFFAGLDDTFGVVPYTHGRQKSAPNRPLDEWLKPLANLEGVLIVGSHTPIVDTPIIRNCYKKPAVCIVGHTHGGQIVFTRWASQLVGLLRGVPSPMSGRRTVDGVIEIGSWGAGTTVAVFGQTPCWGALRLYTPPEIVYIKLVPETSQGLR